MEETVVLCPPIQEASGSRPLVTYFIPEEHRGAREMLLTCEPIDTQTAPDRGLVNRVVPLAQWDDAVNVLAQKLIDKIPECTRYTKTQVNYWKEGGTRRGNAGGFSQFDSRALGIGATNHCSGTRQRARRRHGARVRV